MSTPPPRPPSVRLLSLLVLLAASPAFAEAVNVLLAPRGQVGVVLPNVSLQIQEPIAGFWLKLKRSDGGQVSVKGGGAPGQTRVIDLTQPVGKFHYVGELLVNFPDGTKQTMPVEFDAELFTALQLDVTSTTQDVLRDRKLTFKISRPAGKARVKVLMDSGQVAMDEDVPFKGEPAGTPLVVDLPEGDGRIMKIWLTAYDSYDFFNGAELSPWQLDIPHEEVGFDTGKWDIRADQRSKLDDSYKKIADAVNRYGRLAELKLYIAGHTDTQGSTPSNRTLSLNRARSIAGYFRTRGVRLPIFYEGFGEEALAVKTPDETDEPQNRRAQYFISIGPPVVENAPFKPGWKKL